MEINMSKADGYAVVLDDKGSPYGYWFVGAWNTQESAEIALKGQKGNGRIVPLYFRPEGGASIDEKRYQFLRMNPDGAYFFPQCLPDGTWTMRLVGDTALDAAIDEAMAKQSPMNSGEGG
jgi:hypothetical protein